MKTRGKDHKAGAAAAAIVGGLFAPFTFGGSLLVGGALAAGMYDDGEKLTVEYRTLRNESSLAFASLSNCVGTSIKFIQTSSIMIRGFVTEVQSLASGGSKLQLLRAKRQVAEVQLALEEYIGFWQDLARNYDSNGDDE